MIGSLMSRMGEAQKLSIPQLQQAIQNGTLPPYVGIPLLQEKMQQHKQAQAMQAPQEAPIAQQVMQEADAVEKQRGLAQLQSNLPAEGYADGGIIAFADGGLPDDKTEDDELEELFPTAATSESDLIKLIAMSGGREAPSKSSPSKSEPTPSGNVTSGGGIREIITNAAKKHGLPPELLQKISGSESNYNPNVTNKTGSSAKGLFQFIDSTWAGMGGKPGEQYNPEINADLGGKYIRQNADYLKRSLGRDPSYGDIYAAHFFGPEGASSLIRRADPRSSIEEGLATYSSPAMVKKIMEQNPNLKGKSVGQVLNMLNKKTGEGIVSLAKGGVAHFDKGGLNVNPYEVDDRGVWQKAGYKPFSEGVPQGPSDKPYLAEDFKNDVGNIWQGLSDAFSNKKARQREEALKLGPSRAENAREFNRLLHAQTYKDYDVSGDKKFDPNNPNDKEPPKPVVATPTSPPEPVVQQGNQGNTPSVSGAQVAETTDPYVEKLRERLLAQMEDAKSEGDMNKYLALMQAGLSMMGGTSPYAAVNFGQGASQGIGAFSNLEQARRKEMRDLQAQELGLYKYEQAAKNAAETRKLNEFYRNKSLEQHGVQHKEDLDVRNRQLSQNDLARYRDDYRQYVAGLEANLEKRYSSMMGWGVDPKLMAKYEADRLKIKNDPVALDLYKKAQFPDIGQTPPTGSGNVLKFDASGKPIQ